MHNKCLKSIPHHKGHKWLSKICKLVYIGADSYVLIIYHIVWNIDYLPNTYIASMLYVYIYMYAFLLFLL